jgi:hypothetical protein
MSDEAELERSQVLRKLHDHIAQDRDAAPFLVGWCEGFLTTVQLETALQALHVRDEAIARLQKEDEEAQATAQDVYPQD